MISRISLGLALFGFIFLNPLLAFANVVILLFIFTSRIFFLVIVFEVPLNPCGI